MFFKRFVEGLLIGAVIYVFTVVVSQTLITGTTTGDIIQTAAAPLAVTVTIVLWVLGVADRNDNKKDGF